MIAHVRLVSAARWVVAALAVGCSSYDESPPPAAPLTDASTPPATDAPVTTGLDAGAVDAIAADAAPVPPLTTYANPVLAHDFPDPFILSDGARYYAFATNAGGRHVQAATSTDLAEWSDLPDALPTLPTWAAKTGGLTWAPSVLRRGGAFVLYYTTRDAASQFQCISRAVATTPAGPYVDSSTSPLVCQVSGTEKLCGSIDPSPFVAPDGTPYLLWKSDENSPSCMTPPRLWAQPLSDDGLSVLGAPTALLARDAMWEQPIIEGPSMIEHDGTYFLFYSANEWETANYAIGYATCASPLGPCTKRTTDRPVVASKEAAAGPGGQEFFTDALGRPWMAYHAWTEGKTNYAVAGARSLRIDPVRFEGGAPAFDAPTTAPRSY